MKKINVFIAISLMLIGFVACEDKKDDEPVPTTTTTGGTTGGTTGNNAVVATYNTLVINDTLYEVTAYGNPQAPDYSFYAVYFDSSRTIDVRALFTPKPATTKSFTIIPGAPATDDKTQLTLTYDQVINYNAVSGGTVDVTVNLDSTIIKFNNVKFSKAGSAQKIVSGYYAIEN
ncbi:MAG: hypothetical protein WC760_10070 [Bacteroidia bacterium]|jgi:hypothetical protein